MPIWRDERLVVVVAEHAALRRAGGAAGVDERGEVGRPHASTAGGSSPVVSNSSHACVVAPPTRSAGRADRPRRGPRPRLRRRPSPRALDEVGLDEQHPRPRVGELVAQVLALVGGVDRHRDGAGAHDAPPRERGLGRVLDERRHPVAWSYPELRAVTLASRSARVGHVGRRSLVPQTSRYSPSGSASSRCSSSVRTVLCSPLIHTSVFICASGTVPFGNGDAVLSCRLGQRCVPLPAMLLCRFRPW